jgi:toxin HigB-1
LLVIKTFRCAETKKLFDRQRVRKFESAQDSARRKLEILNAAADLGDLAALPGNRLEKLKGRREGRYSIRMNDQWRLCFVWRNGEAYEVEIVDYH